MTDEELSKKISNAATKIAIRRYPFIMSGDFQGIFEPSYTYKKSYSDIKDDKKVGIRTILWVNPEIFFELYGTDSYLYDSAMNGRIKFTLKYLTSNYDRDSSTYNELNTVDNDILKIFYETGKIMDGKEQLGLLDFFVRYAFMGNGFGDWPGFMDSDTAIPPQNFR